MTGLEKYRQSRQICTKMENVFALVRTISVHNAYIDCYNAVDFRRNLLLDSTASIAVDFKLSKR
jgi:hypothetical protein